jgi:hypothetical protein
MSGTSEHGLGLASRQMGQSESSLRGRSEAHQDRHQQQNGDQSEYEVFVDIGEFVHAAIVAAALPFVERSSEPVTGDAYTYDTMKTKITVIAAATRQRPMNRSSRAVRLCPAIASPSRRTLCHNDDRPAGSAAVHSIVAVRRGACGRVTEWRSH